MKLNAFIDDIVHKQIYGVVINYQYVIEFQRRGLPHAHIAITLHNDDKLIDGDAVDNIISARIPDEMTQPLLYGCVRHKCYPKPYREETALAVGTYIKRAEYKRPNDGRRIYVEAWQRSVTNRRVVPYNAYALATYQCHVSFDAVGSSNTVRYLYKYMFKRPWSVRLYVDKESNGIDEIQDYIDRRYVNAMEATWRLFEFGLHKRSHSVIYLPVHLPGQRELLYNEWDDIDEVDRR
ncbi:uncharacterized protein LOC123322419 [Coccinella septempunctata]|uniref:uncharacterized protein LOC123322419 n=1 Tax=Coccinella septempunctata TaxID=41139 RepID=UPI001D06E890|nr:uncharacterized protein LOC123322419 [Coccinella septempunctata]